MDNTGSIGALLRQERESRGLSLQDVQENTKITPQNLTALEEDRFDSFPNRVYARAFLRDYANFLGLDSSDLLSRYESEWRREPEVEAFPGRKTTSLGWRLARALLVVVLCGGLGVGAYFAWGAYGKKPIGSRIPVRAPISGGSSEVAQLPRASVPSGSDVSEKPKETPKPQPKPEAEPAPAPEPERLVLEVTALRTVWADIQTDGQKAVYGNLGPGTKTLEATKKIYIKVGQANAVQLKLNGKPVEPLGTRPVIGTRVFELKPQPPTSPAPGAGTPAPAASSAVAPSAPSAPAAGGQAR